VVDLIRERLVAEGVPTQPGPLGGLVAGGGQAQPSIAFASAVDEPGLMLSEPVENGVALAYRLGPLPASAWFGQRIRTLDGRPALVLPNSETDAPRPPQWELRVDLGATNAPLAPGAAPFAVPDQPYSADHDQVTGKGLQDRAACAALVDLAIRTTRQDPRCIFIFYCQGQRGEHGLQLALRAIPPQAFVRLRGVRHAPTADANGSAVLAGGGAVLVLRHNASISHPALAEACERAATESDILLQRAVVLSEKPDRPPAETALGGLRRLELGFPVLDADCTRPRVEMRDLEALRRLLGEIAVRGCLE